MSSTKTGSPAAASGWPPVGAHARDTRLVIRRLKQGLPASSLDRLSKQMGVPTSRLARVVNISPRTLARRKREGRLQMTESDRLLRIGSLFEMAVRVLGDVEAAARWFQTPRKALDGRNPLEYADTEAGAREVEDLLGRLQHGVFS